MHDYLLGLEWSTNYFKIVCLKKKNNSYRLFKIGDIAISQTNPADTSRLLGEWVNNNLSKTESVGVVITLPESSIFLKELEIPKVKEKEISETVFWEISSMIPFPSGEAVVQWKKISDEAKVSRLTAIVAKEQTVGDLVSVLEDAGLEVLAIEPSSLSFSRLFGEKLGKTTLLVNAEDEETNFAVLKNAAPVFSTSTPTPLARMKTKRQRLSKEVAADLAADAKNAITFWEEKGEGKIQQVVITGKGIRYSGLATAINSLTHIPAVFARVQKFPKIEIPPSQVTVVERYLIPLGAAARLAFPDQFPEVNLLPKKRKQILDKEGAQSEIAQKVSFFAKVSFFLLLINLVFLAGGKFWGISLQRDIKQTKQFVDNHPAQKFVSQIQADNKILSQVEALEANQKDTGKRLEQISQLIPQNVRLSEISFAGLKNEEWKLSGMGDRTAILAFYEKIKANAQANEVSMPYSNLQKEKEGDFKITIIW